ncbi:hypothetical protein PG999_002968 [Apiospora kogelbergensis]|uniref:F-box domain-containing protein n=1 Tax=Apiospora kogelbergensis TaxID=1337665 RepID=A0AAW0RA12_9PEZI
MFSFLKAIQALHARRTRRSAERNRPTPIAMQQSNSLFLNQPLDVLLTISDHLPPEIAAALSLTCKVALAVFKPKNTDANQRAIRHAFEKNVSKRCFYCFTCGKYHRYSKSWVFNSYAAHGVPIPPCQTPRDHVHMIGIWHFAFHHFQLIMNEHIFGEGCGLLQPEFEPNLYYGKVVWRYQPTLAILGGQCFLSVRYWADLDDTPRENASSLFRCPDWNMFCYHFNNNRINVPIGELPIGVYPRRLPELHILYSKWFVNGFKPELEINNYSSQGHCPVCLTDYTFELSRRPLPGPAGREKFRLDIVTYHQLGACRTPDDWKWRAFISKGPESPPGLVTRQQYIDSEHRPGAVKERWDLGHALSHEENHETLKYPTWYSNSHLT